MQKIIRYLPTYLASIFMLITLNRVAVLAAVGLKAGWLGYVFSTGMEIGEFLFSYYMRVTRYKTVKQTARRRNKDTGQIEEVQEKARVEDPRSAVVRRIALVGLVVFTTIDSYWNMTQVLRDLVDPTLQIAAITYGLFPSFAIILLGYLQGNVERLPKPTEKEEGIGLLIEQYFRKRMQNSIQRERERAKIIKTGQDLQPIAITAMPAPKLESPKQSVIPADEMYRCPILGCEFTAPTRPEMQTHIALHKEKRSKFVDL